MMDLIGIQSGDIFHALQDERWAVIGSQAIRSEMRELAPEQTTQYLRNPAISGSHSQL
jgi:hypothetical protein